MEKQVANAFEIITEVIFEGVKFWPKEWKAELAKQLTIWLQKFALDNPENRV